MQLPSMELMLWDFKIHMVPLQGEKQGMYSFRIQCPPTAITICFCNQSYQTSHFKWSAFMSDMIFYNREN